MRAVFIALLIVLLPVRGWMGDAMALSAAGGPVQAAGSPTAATPGHMPCHGTPSEEALRTVQDSAAHGVADQAGHDHLLCDLCNGPALGASEPRMPSPSRTPGRLPLFSERFGSRVAPQDVRPPIS
jgi:hypothetical protein